MHRTHQHRTRTTAALATLWMLAACETNPSYSFFTYNMAVPSGPTRRYVSDFSWRGLGVDARFPLRPYVTGSVNVGWNLLHDQTNNPFVFDRGAASGLQFRDLQAMSLLGGAQVYLAPLTLDSAATTVRPYVGLLTGGILVERRTDLGLFTILEDQNWHLGFAPQAGLIATVRGFNILLDARYTYGVPSGGGKVSFFGMNVGVALDIH